MNSISSTISSSKQSTRVLLIGYGRAGQLHRKCYPDFVSLIGIVDPDIKIPLEGPRVHENLAMVDQSKVDYIDIATPTATHLEILKDCMTRFDKTPILVEKPLCGPNEIKETRELIDSYDAPVYVQENYWASSAISIIKYLLDYYDVNIKKVRIDFSKNRFLSNINGRFVDNTWGLWGYEGPHIVAILEAVTGHQPSDWTVKGAESYKMSLGLNTNNETVSTAKLTNSKFDTLLHTSVRGICADGSVIAPTDDERRRYLSIQGAEVTIDTYFDPVPFLPKLYTGVTISQKRGSHLILARDDSLGGMLSAVFDNHSEIRNIRRNATEHLENLTLLNQIRLETHLDNS